MLGDVDRRNRSTSPVWPGVACTVTVVLLLPVGANGFGEAVTLVTPADTCTVGLG